MMKRNYFYVTSFSISWDPLRRTACTVQNECVQSSVCLPVCRFSIHPLSGGADDFTNKEKMNGVGQHNNPIMIMKQRL